MKQHIRSLIVGIAILAAIAASSASAQPAQAPTPVPSARVCWVWQNTCVHYVWIFGRYPYCTAFRLTCIRWL